MPSVQLSPVFNIPEINDNDGNPLALGKIYQYEAGSDSIQLATYTTAAGITQNDNPMILDGSGRPQQNIWLLDNIAYHLIVTDALDVPIYQVDNVTGVPIINTAILNAINIWNPETDTVAYVSADQFAIENNHVTDFAIGNRIRGHVDDGFVYGTVTAVSFVDPNTFVTVQMDTVPLDSSLTTVDWSTLIVGGMTIDIGAVSWTSDLAPYTNPVTAGGKISSIQTQLNNLSDYVDSLPLVYLTTGTDVAYEITPVPAIVSYATNQQWQVKFHDASGSSPTFNVNSIGALALQQYNSSGVLVDAVVATDQVSDVMYDGTVMIVVDPLPATPFNPGDNPHGENVYVSNDTWTCPENVTWVTVTCIGGGGGGGSGFVSGGESPTIAPGGNGGYGGVGIAGVSVTPGNNYTISVGVAGSAGSVSAGGTGGTTTFGSSEVQALGGQGGAYATGVVGANGYGNICSYGQYGISYSDDVGNPKGLPGTGGFDFSLPLPTAGTAGMIIIVW